MSRGLPRHLVVSEFQHTYTRHGGRVSIAAPILGMRNEALARALFRARKNGYDVRFIDDSISARRHARGAA